MSDKSERCTDCADDSLEYQTAQGGLQTDDPLAAIKALRLGQLAVCRLKSEQEMQVMRGELESDSKQ